MMFRSVFSMLILLTLLFPVQVMAEEEYWEYTFRPGDSIWKIAEKYTTSVKNWDEIQKINQIRQGPDRKIQPGTRIVIPVSMLKIQPTPAKVIALSGAVQLVRADGDPADIKVGTLLYSGDQLITYDRQNVRIQFADYSELQILPDSEVVLDKLSHHKKTGMVDTRIRLNSGSIDTQVKKQNSQSRYQIKTPAAITAVRGTAFRLSSDKDFISRTEVTEGIVGVSANQIEIPVKEGYGLIAEKGKPLTEPIKLLEAPEVSYQISSDQSTVKLRWVELQGASFYRYQLATDEKFNDITLDATTRDFSVTLTGLKAGHYYHRVRGVDRFQLQGVDAVGEFKVEQQPVVDKTLKTISLPAEILLLNL